MSRLTSALARHSARAVLHLVDRAEACGTSPGALRVLYEAEASRPAPRRRVLDRLARHTDTEPQPGDDEVALQLLGRAS